MHTQLNYFTSTMMSSSSPLPSPILDPQPINPPNRFNLEYLWHKQTVTLNHEPLFSGCKVGCIVWTFYPKQLWAYIDVLNISITLSFTAFFFSFFSGSSFDSAKDPVLPQRRLIKLGIPNRRQLLFPYHQPVHTRCILLASFPSSFHFSIFWNAKWMLWAKHSIRFYSFFILFFCMFMSLCFLFFLLLYRL